MKNTYYIPVEVSNVNYIKVKAATEAQAVQQVKDIMNKTVSIQGRMTILYDDITCEQDDIMLDNMMNDLNPKFKEEDNSFFISVNKEESNA